MAKIKVEVDIRNTKYEWSKKDICDYCKFSSDLTYGGRICTIFNKVTTEEVICEEEDIKGYIRLKECIDSEIIK